MHGFKVDVEGIIRRLTWEAPDAKVKQEAQAALDKVFAARAKRGKAK